MNIARQVNIDGGLERELAQVLRELLESVPWLEGWAVEPVPGAQAPWDLRASGPIHAAGRKPVLLVECKSPNFQPSQFANIADRPCVGGKNTACTRVLAMPRVSQRMAALCRSRGWSWYDLAGNCRLDVTGTASN